jgi:hypothetical protein
MVCSVAPAEFPPYGSSLPSNPTGACHTGTSVFHQSTGSTALDLGSYDAAPTCIADPAGMPHDFVRRSILFQFGQRETICEGPPPVAALSSVAGSSNPDPGAAVAAEVRSLVARAYLGHDVLWGGPFGVPSVTPRSLPSGDWRRFTLDNTAGLELETIVHPYTNGFGGAAAWPGHCLPNQAPVAFPSCAEPAAYSWGAEVVRFFREHPCGSTTAASLPPPPPPPPPPPVSTCSVASLAAVELPSTQALCCLSFSCNFDGSLRRCTSQCAAAVSSLQRRCGAALASTGLGAALATSTALCTGH